MYGSSVFFYVNCFPKCGLFLGAVAHTKAFSLDFKKKSPKKQGLGLGLLDLEWLLLGVATQQARLQIQSASFCRSPTNSMVTYLERLLQVAKQQQDYKCFLPSYLSNSQICLDPHVEGCQCGYTTNGRRKTTIWIFLQIPYTSTTKTGMDFVGQFLFHFFKARFFLLPGPSKTQSQVRRCRTDEESTESSFVDSFTALNLFAAQPISSVLELRGPHTYQTRILGNTRLRQSCL